MHTLLQRLLEKRNVDIKDLQGEEKNTFSKWESMLSGKEVTVEKIADFCKSQVMLIETQWDNLDNPDKKNERLILLHTVYQKIGRLISAEQREREQLEKYLTELIDNDAGQTL